MKKHIFYCLLTAVLYTNNLFSQNTNLDHGGSVTNGFRLSISLKGGTNTVPLGQPVVLISRLQNISSNTMVQFLEFVEPIKDGSYGVSITSPTGKDLSPKIYNFPEGSFGLCDVGPGQIHEAQLQLSLVCKFETIGRYKIVVTKKIRALRCQAGSNQLALPFEVVSNPLYVNVVP